MSSAFISLLLLFRCWVVVAPVHSMHCTRLRVGGGHREQQLHQQQRATQHRPNSQFTLHRRERFAIRLPTGPLHSVFADSVRNWVLEKLHLVHALVKTGWLVLQILNIWVSICLIFCPLYDFACYESLERVPIMQIYETKFCPRCWIPKKWVQKLTKKEKYQRFIASFSPNEPWIVETLVPCIFSTTILLTH